MTLPHITVWIAVLLLSGCGEKQDPNGHLQHAKEKLTGIAAREIKKLEADAERMKKEFRELKATYERFDFSGLKKICAELDARYDQRILSWYADILLIEHTQGAGAAQEAITDLRAKADLMRKEARALEDIERYFREKGEATTARLGVRLLLTGYAVYLEAEYGHGASAPMAALLEMTDKKVQPDAAANPGQPIQPDTNATSSAAGFRR